MNLEPIIRDARTCRQPYDYAVGIIVYLSTRFGVDGAVAANNSSLTGSRLLCVMEH